MHRARPSGYTPAPEQRAGVTPAGSFYLRRGKRVLDLAVALPALVVLLPLLAVLAAMVRWRLGSPVLFRQERIGYQERRFRLLKLRSMTNARDEDGRLLPDGERLTPFGLWLRRWSLDELPQLWNVLRGDLSLVGPRPLMIRYLPRYSARQRARHQAMPGLTGWSQVKGRDEPSWEVRLERDVWYVEHRSLALDLRILALTVLRLLRPSDALAGSGVDLDEFWGADGRPAGGPRALPVDETEEPTA